MLDSFECADAGEEELFLDALSICGMPLAVVGQMLAPAALLELGLLPEEVALQPVSPPYKYLLACKVRFFCPVASWRTQAGGVSRKQQRVDYPALQEVSGQGPTTQDADNLQCIRSHGNIGILQHALMASLCRWMGRACPWGCISLPTAWSGFL